MKPGMKPDKPNILLILADQHRYDCIGCAGTYPVNTPNIDRLAREGVWFSNAYTPIPVCCPARQSMLSGRRPETFGALWNYNGGLKISALGPEEYTWVKDLKEHGYRTGHAGKWSINPEYGPCHYGFDDQVQDSGYRDFRSKAYPQVKFFNGFFGETDPVPLEHSHTHWLAGQTMKLMEEYARDGRPWLISLDFSEPHLPCRPSEPFASMYNPSDVPMWPSFKENFENKPYIQKQQLYSWNIDNFTWDDWAPIVARYYGIISQIDDAMGIILDRLDSLGLAENTLVIYTSDHGDMCGAHRMIDKHYVLYDDIARVPLIARWPGIIKGGTVCDDFICHSLDIPPTMLDVTGIGKKEFFQGKSFLPLLTGERSDMPGEWRNHVVSTYNGQQFGLYTQRMIRTREWKYIWNTTDMDELYDLVNDPHELQNVIYEYQHKGLVVELRRKLYEELVRDGDGLVKGNEWMKNQLLGGKKL
ncbi:MAG: sulfatase-like hydrolase/transferase [Clostridiaceae bacterium]|nr:sulfatase-like hydrolase/transferase [Clostridiaceae bacterium]